MPESRDLVELLARVRLEGVLVRGRNDLFIGVADPASPDGGRFYAPASSAAKLIRQRAADAAPKSPAKPGKQPSKPAAKED